MATTHAPTRKCIACGTAFKVNARGRPRTHCNNSDCMRARNRERLRLWRAANPERFRELKRRYYAANPEKARGATRRWQVANPEKYREMKRRWRAANPEKVKEKNRIHHQKRKALVRVALEFWRRVRG